MSIHVVAETTPATKDAQVIADMAAAVLASIARIHADGLVAVSTIAENPVPVRVELPPAAEPTVASSPARSRSMADGPPHGARRGSAAARAGRGGTFTPTRAAA